MRLTKISAGTFCLAASLCMGMAGCKSNGTGTDSSTVNAATDPAALYAIDAEYARAADALRALCHG